MCCTWSTVAYKEQWALCPVECQRRITSSSNKEEAKACMDHGLGSDGAGGQSSLGRSPVKTIQTPDIGY